MLFVRRLPEELSTSFNPTTKQPRTICVAGLALLRIAWCEILGVRQANAVL
jgi:hypothetical protein